MESNLHLQIKCAARFPSAFAELEPGSRVREKEREKGGLS